MQDLGGRCSYLAGILSGAGREDSGWRRPNHRATPFKVIVRVNELRDSERFEVYRQGLDEDVVRLVS